MNWLEKLMAKQAVQYLLRKGGFMFNFIDGYKTYIAALLMIITGGLQMAGYAPDFICFACAIPLSHCSGNVEGVLRCSLLAAAPHTI